ncbi:MAG: sigma 54-interacting transcriptional regulator [candidate division Zixibacteria bacterium]|nr:sigma 54-interacting transcriptional regulator [candidate division Zixibacteria bacterium]
MKGRIVKAADLEIGELVEVRDGNLNLHGRRLVIHSIHAFEQFRRDIVTMLGCEEARRLITRFGFFWGQADAAAMRRVFEWTDLSELLEAGFRLQSIEGAAKASLKSLELDEIERTLHLECEWRDSVSTETKASEQPSGERPECWELVGYASGYASLCMDKSVYFVEQQCERSGDLCCRAIGKDVDSWGDEILPYLRYFEGDDIKGNVEQLTRELRKKTRQIAVQRKQLDALRKGKVSFFIEGRSNALRRVVDLAERVAQFDSSLLITGETGVGKEVFARYIHDISHRSKAPMVALNCGALPETLLESELFGCRAGAFTGAVRDRVGLFEQAEHGTVFLDEIGDITPAMQVRILRVLQEKEIMRLGESEPRKVDIRVIAATNRNLDEAVANGTFREDLLYRLRVIEIEIPPLRQRREDILPLARFLIEKLARKLGLPNLRFDATCVDYLQAHDWPGNVRELENAIERAAVLSRDGTIMPDGLPLSIVGHGKPGVREGSSRPLSLAQMEDDHIQLVLTSTGGNRTQAAKILGISQATLWRKLKQRET